MAKYVVIECNRQNSQSNYGNLDESSDIYKNLWVNNVSSTGIQVETGDTISCVSAAINNVGASDEVMEFIGNTQQGYLDNKIKLKAGYYVNHTGRNTGMLPYKGMTTVDNALPANPAGYRQNNYRRLLGTPNLQDYTTVLPDDIQTSYLNKANIPNANFLFRIQQTGISGLKYKVGDVLNNWTVTTGSPPKAGTGLIIKITEITNETAASEGLPSKFQVLQVGTNYLAGDTLTDATTGITPNPTPKMILSVRAYPNGGGTPVAPLINFATTNYGGQPDGNRYFFSDVDYTGCLSKYDGMPSDERNDTDLLNTEFNIRNFDIDLEVPIGFNTPDNIGGILTDILHKPRLYNGMSDNLTDWKYINPNNVEVASRNIQDTNFTGRPNILQTPTWQPIACNGNGIVVSTNTNNTLTGALHAFHSMTAWEKPDRLKWLGQFNSFYYGLNETDPKNEVFTGRASTHIQDVGDFGDQVLGEYTVIPRLLNQLVFSSSPTPEKPDLPYTYYNDNYSCSFQKGAFIISTIFYTEEMVKKIADILHNTEEYYGDRSQTIDELSTDYNNNLACMLDLGKYCDTQSQGFPVYNPPVSSTNPTLIYNQRSRYASSNLERTMGFEVGLQTPETATNGNNIINVNFVPDFNVTPTLRNNRVMKGDQPFNNNDIGTDGKNDNYQLSQLIVSSRWQDSIRAPSYINPASGGASLIYVQTYNSCTGNFNMVEAGRINEQFKAGYDGVTYEEMIGWAKKYDVPVIPVYPLSQDIQIGTEEYRVLPDSKGVGRPFLAFRSHFDLGEDTPMDRIKNTGQWWIDGNNCLEGTYLGYDGSFIRNKAVQAFNLQHPSNTDYDKGGTYNPIMYIGAVNPSFQYSPLLSRFELSGLNTPMTIGNGKNSDLPNFQEANDDPEQVVYQSSGTGAIMPFSRNTQGIPLAKQTYDKIWADQIGIIQKPDTLFGSQSGISIIGMSLYKTGTLEEVPLTSTDYSIYVNTLFHKMGFDLNQFLPIFGNSQAIFVSKLPISQATQTYLQAIENTVKPVTTGAYISSAEFQPLSVNEKNYPMYDLGGDVLINVTPAVSQANLVGQRLPQKLDFPYLCVYSSIVSSGTDTLYIGSGNGKQLIPCMAFITRNYSSGDFFYGLEQSFSYTATKNFTLTDITTDIRLPDGTRPQLQPHSSVIYKITKPQNGLPAVMPTETKKIMSHNTIHHDDKDRRDRIKKAV
jgi:hypothetical protein